mgnify:FL=1
MKNIKTFDLAKAITATFVVIMIIIIVKDLIINGSKL